jgi:hypothetical protein
VKELTAFYEAIADDARIGTTHICLYLALYNAVSFAAGELSEVNRDQLMQQARISRKTYNKCMKELQEYGYIKYEPSSNPQVGSRVQLKKL